MKYVYMRVTYAQSCSCKISSPWLSIHTHATVYIGRVAILLAAYYIRVLQLKSWDEPENEASFCRLMRVGGRKGGLWTLSLSKVCPYNRDD